MEQAKRLAPAGQRAFEFCGEMATGLRFVLEGFGSEVLDDENLEWCRWQRPIGGYIVHHVGR